jgi:hypothetical protein
LVAGQNLVDANLPEITLAELITKRRLRREANAAATKPQWAAADEPKAPTGGNQSPTLEEEPDLESESSAADDDDDDETPLGDWDPTPVKSRSVHDQLLPPDTPVRVPVKTPQSVATVPSLPGMDDHLPTQGSDFMAQEVPKAVQTESQIKLAITPMKKYAPGRLSAESSPRSHRSHYDAAATSPLSVRSAVSENSAMVLTGHDVVIPATQSRPADQLEPSTAGASGPDSSEAVANSSISKPKSSAPEVVRDVADKPPKRKSADFDVDDDPEDEQRYQKRAKSIQRVVGASHEVRSSPIPVAQAIATIERFHSARATPVSEPSRSRGRRSVQGSSSPPRPNPSRTPEIPSERAREISPKRGSLRSSAAPSLSRNVVMRDYTAQDIYHDFRDEYADYTAPIEHFFNLCRLLRDPKKLRVPQVVWDDFIVRHFVEYRPYIVECVMNGEKPMDYEEYYDLVTSIKYPLKVMTPALVITVIRDAE